MTVREFMQRVDARIYKSRIVRAVADFGVVDGVEGALFLQPREIQILGTSLMTTAPTFECQYREEFANLEANGALVSIDGQQFRFLREYQPGGDESGNTIIELGELV